MLVGLTTACVHVIHALPIPLSHGEPCNRGVDGRLIILLQAERWSTCQALKVSLKGLEVALRYICT